MQPRKGSRPRFEPNVTVRHAEMGNLLSLYPKTHRLWADTEDGRCLPNSQRNFVSKGKGDLFPPRCWTRGGGSWIPSSMACFGLRKQTKCSQEQREPNPSPSDFGPVIIVQRSRLYGPQGRCSQDMTVEERPHADHVGSPGRHHARSRIQMEGPAPCYLKSLALGAYRSRALTAAQRRRLLGFETRMQVDACLREREVYDFTTADFEQDRETLRSFERESSALS
jgi:hypothetical protein